MPVHIDLEAILATRRDGQPRAFVIRPAESASPDVDLLGVLQIAQQAVADANDAAELIDPEDPLWANGPDLVGSELRVRLEDGIFMDSSVRAWFAALEGALATAPMDLEVVVAPRRKRVPNLDAWIEMPPAVTAFMSFEPELGGEWRRQTPGHVKVEAAQALADWCTLAGGVTSISRGDTEFVVDPEHVVREMRLNAQLGLPVDLRSVVVQKRRGRFMQLSHMLENSVQVIDATRPYPKHFRDLLTPLRVLGPYLEYAWVRRAMNTGPGAQDVALALKRNLTPVEDRARPELLADYVIEASVAQVLTDRHMARVGDLSGFDVEELPRNRYLILAQDPEPWLANLNPDPEILARAREAFGDALLTLPIIEEFEAELRRRGPRP